MRAFLLFTLLLLGSVYSSTLYDITDAKLEVYPNEVQSKNASWVFTFILQHELGVNKTANATFDFTSLLSLSGLNIIPADIKCSNLSFTFGNLCKVDGANITFFNISNYTKRRVNLLI